MKKNSPQINTVQLSLKDRPYDIEYFIREGNKETILFIHGLGGAKENFWESCKTDALADHTLICFDNPGTGNSTYYEDTFLDVDELAEVAAQFIKKLSLDKFFIAGASMGGLITMLYLAKYGSKNIKGFINIEGNLMPEDCMFSSKVVMHDYDHFNKVVFPEIITSMKKNGNTGYHIIANNLELNTTVRAYYQYSFQTVKYSDTGELLKQYLSMDIPRMFVYGEENKNLSYIPKLLKNGMNVCMIQNSNHFIFYDNPNEMYNAISKFINA